MAVDDDDRGGTTETTLEEVAKTLEALRRRVLHLEERVANLEAR